MNQQHEDERSRIRSAMDQLLAGQPTRSNGSLTAVALARPPKSKSGFAKRSSA